MSSVKSVIQTKCPYQEGSAVYKARTLNAMFNPTQMYDDIDICNTVGVYKTNNSGSTKGMFGIENAYLQNIKPKTTDILLNVNEIKVYPNPANSILNISYNVTQDATLKIMDMLGQVVIETVLSNKTNHAIIDVNILKSGVYVYQLSSKEVVLKSDKLIIE